MLYVSGYPENIIAPHGVLETGLHFLPKPFSVSALTTMVRAILDEASASMARPARAKAATGHGAVPPR